jgi:hypothetical protein
MQIIEEHGGIGVSEIKVNSEPDISFHFLGMDWIPSVKIGEKASTLKSAFVQYQRHKQETGVRNGIILFLPEEARKVSPTHEKIKKAVDKLRSTCLVDTPNIQDQYSLTFPQLLLAIKQVVVPDISVGMRRTYPPLYCY